MTTSSAMISSGHQYQSGYGQIGNGNMMTQHDHRPSQQTQLTGLDALAQGSQYALQQLHDSNLRLGNQNSQHRESYSSGKDESNSQQPDDPSAQANGKSGAGGPVRRRISRACDQCNQLRTKCDGKTPCAHCVGMLARPALSCPCMRADQLQSSA